MSVRCGWCGRWKQRDGTYGDRPPPSHQEGTPVSHGLCEQCEASLYEQAGINDEEEEEG